MSLDDLARFGLALQALAICKSYSGKAIEIHTNQAAYTWRGLGQTTRGNSTKLCNKWTACAKERCMPFDGMVRLRLALQVQKPARATQVR